MQNFEDLATTDEIALELKRAPETLQRWRRLRKGPPYIRLHGRILYERQAVKDWVASHKVACSQQ